MTTAERIVNHLLLFSGNLSAIGLYTGKTGVAMALGTYGHAHGLSEVEEYAQELLQEALEQVFETLPAGLHSGLAGVGYALAYLKRHAGLKVNLSDALYDIDRHIMAYDPRRLADASLRTGAAGIWCYRCMRLEAEPDAAVFDAAYTAELRTALRRMGADESRIGARLMPLDLKRPQWAPADFLDHGMALDDGAAYYLIHSEPPCQPS